MKPIALSHDANRAVAGKNLHAETEAATAAATRSDSSPPANAGIVGHLLVGLDVGSTTVKLVAMAQQIRPASTEPTYWPVYNHEQIPTTNSPVGRSISYTSTTTAAARADPTPIITPQQGNAHTTTSLVDEFLGSLEFTTVFECYKRHRYDVNGTVLEAFREFFDALPDVTQRYQTAQKILRDTFSRISGITVDLGESEHPPSSMAHNSHENTNATASSDIKEENYEQCLFTTACVTGSCGMQLAEALGLPFVHEVVACAEAVRKLIQQHVDVAIELGGEDAKIMRFTENSMDTQMNSTCAAGTGAFIDQMAALLQTDAAGLNAFALEHKSIHPIAARCAVFAKTDVQTLLSEGATKEDISASVLQAVAVQAIGGLSGGRRLSGNVVMLGGPMHFLPGLREAVCSVAMTAGAQNAFTPPHAHAMVCSGAALHGYGKFSPMPLSFLLRRVDRYFSGIGNSSLQVESSIPSQRLPPLFTCEDELIAFQQRHSLHSAKRGNIEATSGPLFIGIDSGSTTFKTAVIDCHGNLLHTIYSSHRGETMSTAVTALAEIQKLIGYVSTGSFFAAACATGYSEQLIKKAFRVEYGVVETMAHLKAAKFLHPDADFVLDIGGQDMKCISISEDGVIKDMFLNEACSSGCGSFIQSVANVLGLTIEKFVEAGLKSRSPVDLGTRCTVFMNSRIKQAQQDGASLEDISAGLAISVVKNALFKVMRVRSMTSLGKRIVVQGGMFLNDAVLRALEIVAGVEVIRPDIAGNMGAFGAALEAKAMWEKQLMTQQQEQTNCPVAHSTFLSLDELTALKWKSVNRRCCKCTNNCLLTIQKFHHINSTTEHISGNRCSLGSMNFDNPQHPPCASPQLSLNFHSTGTSHPLSNMFEWQRRRVFRIADPTPPARCRGSVGIPRALQFYDEFPFWEAVFRALRFEVLLSRESSDNLFSMGLSSIPVDGCCLPIKLLHGHLVDLIKNGRANFILLPCEPMAAKDIPSSSGSPFERALSATEYDYQYGSTSVLNHCPLLSGYHNVIASNLDTAQAHFLHPAAPLFDLSAAAQHLYVQLAPYFSDITKREVSSAMKAGALAQQCYRDDIKRAGEEALRYMRQSGANGVVLACRPYHLDPWFGANSVARMLTAWGYWVLTCESIVHLQPDKKTKATQGWPGWRLLNTFVYDSRVLHSALAVVQAVDLLLVHFMSFGCSISPETDDEIKALFRYFNHPHCAIKIDQNANMASLRVRVRSLLATWEEQRAQKMGASLTASSLASRTSTSNTTISTCTSTGITTKASVSSLRPIPYRADSCCKAPTTILFMNFSPEHTKLYATAFNTGGYHSIPCPDIPEVARNELAMRYIHPDVCYGVSIVVGSWLYALLNGLVDPNNTDVMWIHMGGSCTSRRMAWFARDAFDRAGFPQVGVFSIDCSATVNPAYTLGQTLRINMGLAWGDALSMVLYRTRPYELIPNSANTLHQTWMERALASVSTGSPVLFSSLVHEMVKDFEALPLWTETHDKPRVGLVGLMCKADPVKYNWLLRFLEEEQQCEVAPFFFTEYSEVAGYNNVANHNYFASDTGKWLGGAACRKVICLFRNPVLSALGKSKRFIHPLPLENLENLAKRFVSPLHQAGEGWLIVAQILQHLQNGVSNIVVTAPSGCLPIHIGGRGMMKAIQEQYPQANIVVLDYDSSASFIHQLNRIKLMLWCAKDKPVPPHRQLCSPRDIEDSLLSLVDGPPPPHHGAPPSTTCSSGIPECTHCSGSSHCKLTMGL